MRIPLFDWLNQQPENRERLYLLLFAVVIIFSGIGLRDPWPADEPRFVEVAKEMVQSGNWMFPMRGGELYPDKPPVFMWCIAFFYWLSGSMRWSFLLPSALAALATFTLCYDIAKRLWDRDAARWAAVLLLTAPQFLIQAKSAQIDALLAFWVTLGMYGLLRHFYIRPNWGWYFTAWAAMAAGILTKGVGFLPLLFLCFILLLHFSHRYDYRRAMSWRLALGPVVLIVVCLCWLLPLLYMVEHGGNPDFAGYRDNILFKQTGERYVNSWGHIKPWYYFIVEVIPVVWFPLSVSLLKPAIWRKERALAVSHALLIWVALVVIFFSISPGKRGVYVLPALPMLAVALAPVISRDQLGKYLSKAIIWGGYVLIALFWMLAFLCFVEHKSILKLISDSSHQHSDAMHLGFMFLAVSIAASLFQFRLRHQHPILRFGATMTVVWLFYSFIAYPLLNPIRTPAKAMMLSIKEQIGPEGQLGLVDFKEQFLLFSPVSLTHFSYLDSKTEQARNAWAWMHEDSNRFILTQKKENVDCFDLSKGQSLGKAHRRTWVLLSQNSMLSDCAAPEKVRRYQQPFTQPY